MTLIAVYTGEGCVGRCDAKCYNARCGPCDCICGGANHGAGQARAIANTQEMAERWLEAYAAAHSLTEYRAEVPALLEQLRLF